VVYELRKDFPDARIMLLAIFPRGNGPSDPNRKKNEEANKIIAKLDDGKHVFLHGYQFQVSEREWFIDRLRR